MNSTYLGMRTLTREEKKTSDADFVFLREDFRGRKIEIFVSKPTFKDDPGSWQQWGADTEYLQDNVMDIEDFFSGRL